MQRRMAVHRLRIGLVLGILVAAATMPSATAARSMVGAATGLTAFRPDVTLQWRGSLGQPAVPLVVAWPEATSVGSPIARYELESSRDGGIWFSVPLGRAMTRRVVVKANPWTVLRYRVRALDSVGNASDWAESAPVWLAAPQEDDPSVELAGSWYRVAASKAYGRHRAISGASGATATLRFTGRTVAWVARLGPGAGAASVAIDGGAPTVVNLRRSRASARVMVFRASLETGGEHVLTITAMSSAGVDVDAFVVLADPPDAALVGAGDIATCYLTSDSDTAALVNGLDGIVFTAGDNVYPDGAAQNYSDCYDPSWGILKSRTRPVLGNHDYMNSRPNAPGYFGYFGSAAGDPGKGWYRYNAGTWRIYALNSECKTTICAEQLAWLEADLAAEPHLCTLAIWHRPRWGPNPGTDWPRMDPVWKLLAASHAEVVINGHNHMYARYVPLDVSGAADPNGIRNFVVGTGGAGLYAYSTVNSLMAVQDHTTHGVLKLDLTPGGYSWEFLPTQIDGFTDSGSDSCH